MKVLKGLDDVGLTRRIDPGGLLFLAAVALWFAVTCIKAASPPKTF